MRLIALAIILLLSECVFAEEKSTQSYFHNEIAVSVDSPFITLEQPQIFPVYEGGESALFNFIQENIKYSGEKPYKIIVGFTVDTLGFVRNVIIRKGASKKTEKEATRVVEMLRFKPGSRNGKLVETNMVIPIKFNPKPSEPTKK